MQSTQRETDIHRKGAESAKERTKIEEFKNLDTNFIN
jgi:hypothetical protein